MINTDELLTRVTIRLRNPKTKNTIGSGVIYAPKTVSGKFYLLTAAHCLFLEPDKFGSPLVEVLVEIYNDESKEYQSYTHKIDYNYVSSEEDLDLAILVLDDSLFELIQTTNLPTIELINTRVNETNFIIKGFPWATNGEELDSISPTWKQEMSCKNRFQLNLIEDYTSHYLQGFSGSGVYVNLNNEQYLIGIMTRFRSEEKGKAIYCQYLNYLNVILGKNFLPTLEFSFLGEHGLTFDFFEEHIRTSLKGLGPRYSKELNFKLPIARIFNTLSKDEIFKKRILKCFKDWNYNKKNNFIYTPIDEVKETIEEIEKINQNIIKEISSLNWNLDEPVNIQTFLDLINEGTSLASSKLYDINKLEYKKSEKTINTERKKSSYSNRHYENEILYLRQVISLNHKLIDSLDDFNIELANNPCLIVKGDAGQGKSHLLGDIAINRIENRLPTLLLLGQSFTSAQTVWQNILSQLGLSCTQLELLTALNNIGRQKNCRVLFMIDAINEGDGKTIWPNVIESFISQFQKYKFLGLVISVRTTYLELIPDSLIRNNPSITIINHEGFKGNEYAALQMFCNHHHLVLPRFPIVSPEFINPLFLKLICEGLQVSGRSEFPSGFQGVIGIYDFYISSITNKLKLKRPDDYLLITNDVKKAIEIFAKESFNNSSKQLTLEYGRQLFSNHFPNLNFLLLDLIEESVFNKSIQWDYKTQQNIEVLYFSFERIGDYYMAEFLISSFSNKVELLESFQSEKELGKLMGQRDYWQNSGILEAFSILLPEKFDLEIFEAYKWIFEKNRTQYVSETLQLNNILLETLKWRVPENINDEKITNWLNSPFFDIAFEETLTPFIELTAHKNHPFNSDRLFIIFKRYKMPQRERFWQMYMLHFNGYGDYHDAYPLRRLIDWAWTPRISSETDPETARLVGQTLAWVLSSTNIVLRDETTKAMVNLLENQITSLISILKKFKSIDDIYILERLYAIAYGCALRTKNKDGLKSLAQLTFDHIFKKGQPPNHLLLRDYARNIIEFSIYNGLKIKGDMNLIRPPYNSKLPIMPSPQDISKFHIDYNSKDYKELKGYEYNRIHYSVMDWDFGRYTIKHAFGKFSPISFTIEAEYKIFLKKIKGIKSRMVKLVEAYCKDKYFYENLEGLKKERFIEAIKEQYEFDEFVNTIISTYEDILERLKGMLTLSQYDFLINILVPHFEDKNRKSDWTRDYFNTEPIKRWIVKRSFELGYDVKLHSDYESMLSSLNNRLYNKTERIGKKYQWIAYYEMLGIISDNYNLKNREGSPKEKFYDFARDLSVRNIDPAFVTKNPTEMTYWDYDSKDDDETNKSDHWWFKAEYDFWNQPSEIWIHNQNDLPDPKQLINVCDPNGKEWIYLKLDYRWERPQELQVHKSDSDTMHIDYGIQSYLIRKKDKQKIVRKINSLELGERSIDLFPSIYSVDGDIFNRENYWLENSEASWDKISQTKIEVINTLSDAVHEMSQDQSNAHFVYQMPSKWLFQNLHLEYDSIDGDFVDSSGNLIVKSVYPLGELIDKGVLTNFLDENELEIIWTLSGEKVYFNNVSDSSRSNMSAVYFFDPNQQLSGDMKFSNEF